MTSLVMCLRPTLGTLKFQQRLAVTTFTKCSFGTSHCRSSQFLCGKHKTELVKPYRPALGLQPVFNRRSCSRTCIASLKTTNMIQSGRNLLGYTNEIQSNTTFLGNTNSQNARSYSVMSHQKLTEKDHEEVEKLFQGILRQERGSLSRGITLIESTHPRKLEQAQVLLSRVLKHNKDNGRLGISDAEGSSFRIGLSGPPGAGKSTFIEAFGKFLTAKGHKVAVLAVDPSSSQTGGSLLGDKTRMPDLSCDLNAYIRPSPSRGSLGGVTRTTNDAIVLCEAANYDIILVETVGVGQSEFVVSDMVDMFCLIIPPAGGDELQGIKKGIVEVADMVVVNKSDGDLVPAARRIQMEYVSAIKYMRQRSHSWKPQVIRISSLTREGIPEMWQMITEYKSNVEGAGEFTRKRERQQTIWMWNYVRDHIMDLFNKHPAVRELIQDVEAKVASGEATPGQGADILLRKFVKDL